MFSSTRCHGLPEITSWTPQFFSAFSTGRERESLMWLTVTAFFFFFLISNHQIANWPFARLRTQSNRRIPGSEKLFSLDDRLSSAIGPEAEGWRDKR